MNCIIMDTTHTTIVVKSINKSNDKIEQETQQDIVSFSDQDTIQEDECIICLDETVCELYHYSYFSNACMCNYYVHRQLFALLDKQKKTTSRSNYYLFNM